MICWAEYPSVKTLPLLPNPQPSPPVYHHHRLSLCYLEGDFSCHGEAMGDNRLFFCGATLPTVQFNAAAPRKEDLFVHLDRRVACELAGCTEHKKQLLQVSAKLIQKETGCPQKHILPLFKSSLTVLFVTCSKNNTTVVIWSRQISSPCHH